MSYSDSIDIEKSAQTVFDIITNLPAMGRLSPENNGGEWLNGAIGPCAGATFRGDNARAGDKWSTIATVRTYDPPNKFVFDVKYGIFKISRWQFEIEPTGEGCRVTESWTDRRNSLARKQGDSNGFVRAEFTKDSIRQTLERLKELCEAPSQ